MKRSSMNILLNIFFCVLYKKVIHVWNNTMSKLLLLGELSLLYGSLFLPQNKKKIIMCVTFLHNSDFFPPQNCKFISRKYKFTSCTFYLNIFFSQFWGKKLQLPLLFFILWQKQASILSYKNQPTTKQKYWDLLPIIFAHICVFCGWRVKLET